MFWGKEISKLGHGEGHPVGVRDMDPKVIKLTTRGLLAQEEENEMS